MIILTIVIGLFIVLVGSLDIFLHGFYCNIIDCEENTEGFKRYIDWDYPKVCVNLQTDVR